METLSPGVRGRTLTVEEFMAQVPEKLELIAGEIPDAERLVLLLLTQLGLRRVVQLVEPELWKIALCDDAPPPPR